MANNPSLIVVHGAPASGKTHFSQWLSQQLDIPLLSKDDIKEELFNHFEYASIQQSQAIGAASFDLLWLWLSKLMPFRPNLIIETAFVAAYSQPKISDLIRTYNYQLIQVFCYSEEAVRHQRYVDRAHGDERHPGHMDQQRLAEFVDQPGQPAHRHYQAMELPGTLIKLDTTDLDHLPYQDVLNRISQELSHAD